MTAERSNETARQGAERDCELVIRAAQWCDISEYEFFVDAYRAWHSDAPDERHIEELFAAFMFAGVVPFWVRDFARKTLLPHPSEPSHSSWRVGWRELARFAWALVASAAVTGGDRPHLDFDLFA